MLIWWLNQLSHEAVGELPDDAPEYLKREFRSRAGRAGRGRLWVDDQFGDAEVNPWPNTPLAKELGGDYGGIVIRDEDLLIVRTLPGIITDMQLNRV